MNNKLEKSIKLLFKYANKYSTGIVVIGLIAGILPLLRTYFLSNIINQITNSNMKLVYFYFFIFSIVIFSQSILEPIKNLLSVLFSNHLENTLEVDILKHLSKMKVEDIEDEAFLILYEGIQDKAGQKISVGFLSFFNLVSITIQMIGLIIALLSNSLKFIFVIFVLLLLVIFITKNHFNNKTKNVLESAKLRRYSNYLRDILTSREIYSERILFRYSNYLIHKWKKFLQEMKKIEKKEVLFWLISIKSISIISLISFFIIIMDQTNLLYSGIITPGYLISILTLVVTLSNNLSWSLSDNIEDFITYITYSSYLYNFFLLNTLENETIGTDEIIELDNIKTLRIENLSFSYPKTSLNVLNNINFTFYSDKSYALVGENGSGKSTLFKILSGLYTDYEGEILINDKNVKDYKFNLLQKNVTPMFQKFGTYDLSLIENILFSREIEEDEVISILDDINFFEDNKISLNDNLGKMDSDIDLSGGQWQKLALARAIYRPSNLILFDEPTSSLDPIAESKLYTLMRRKLKEQFSIVISHRLAIAKQVDIIIVLKNGKIVEIGSHYDLMKLGGIYKNMYDKQKVWYENE